MDNPIKSGAPQRAAPPTTGQRTRRFLWRVVRLPLIAYLVVCLMMMWLENSLLFIPTRYPDGEWNPVGLRFEDATFASDNGAKLHGWYVPHSDPRAVVLFAHGNGGNITHRSDRLESFHRLGLSVLMFDYQGYGRSAGAPSATNIMADARAARRWLAERAGVAEGDIVLYGESLGGGVAVDLAAKDGARGLILESTFDYLPGVAAHHYPWLPVRLLMRSRIDSLGQIKNYHGPLLWSHGTADRVIPYEFGKRLFDAANEPKIGVTRAGADHNGPPHPEDDPKFRAALEEFLALLPSGS